MFERGLFDSTEFVLQPYEAEQKLEAALRIQDEMIGLP